VPSGRPSELSVAGNRAGLGHSGQAEIGRIGQHRSEHDAPILGRCTRMQVCYQPLVRTAHVLSLPEPVKGTILAPKPRESGECRFKERIEDKGLILVHVSREEADASHRAHAFAKVIGNQRRELREGFAVVDPRGNVTRIDQRTTGDQWEEIQKRLGGIDKAELLTAAGAKERQAEIRRAAWIEQRRDDYDKAGPATAIEQAILDYRLTAREEGRGELKTVYGAEAFAARLDQAELAIVRITVRNNLALSRMEKIP
jgi:hypothetical protein